MKKIAKISLAAAVAVAGLTTANAQPLEQAIKGVETSGSVVYRYNDNNGDTNDLYYIDGSEYANDHTGGAFNGIGGTEAGQNNNYKAAINLAAPVNDFVKLNTRFVVASATNDFVSLETSDGGDGNVNVALSNAYFGYTGIKNTTVNVGKQGLTTPWTVATQVDGNEQTGTGALALSTLGNVTLAAAYFNQTNLGSSVASWGSLANDLAPKKSSYVNDADENGKIEKTEYNKSGYDAAVSDYDKTISTLSTNSSAQDVAAVGAIVAVGPVTLDSWYLDLQNTFDSYTIGAKSNIELGGVKLGADARFVSLELDRNFAESIYQIKSGVGSFDTLDTSHDYTSNIHDDNSLAKLTLPAKAGIFDAKAAYAKTGKEGGLTALDNDSVTTIQGWSVNANGKADANYYQLVAGVDILPELNLSANYVNVDYTGSDSVTKDANNVVQSWDKTSVEEEEIYAQLLYKMSKNLTSYVRYGVYSKDTSTHSDSRATGTGENAKHGDSRADSIDDTRGRIQVAYTF